MIRLGLYKKNLLIKAIEPNFEIDRNRLLSIPEREPVENEDEFLGWSVPMHYLGEVLEKWKVREDSLDIKKLIEEYELSRKPLSELPKDVLMVERFDKEPLLEYQKDYIRLTSKRTRIICAADTGLGKCTMSLLRAKQLGYTKIIIVGPKSTLSGWQAEIRANLGLDSFKYIAELPNREASKEFILKSGIIICNYEMLSEVLEYAKANKIKWDQIIIDEAHLVSRYGKLRNKLAKALVKHCPKAGLQLLTGTPILKDVEDLYELVCMVSPEISGSRSAWIDRYVDIIATETVKKTLAGGRVIEYERPLIKEPKNLDDCHKRIQAVMIRVERQEILTFKEDSSFKLCPMVGNQEQIYSDLEDKLYAEWERGEVTIQNVLSKSLRLLQAAEGVFNFDSESNDSGKLEYLFDVLDNTAEKIIVWSRFKPITYKLMERYPNQGVLFTGDVRDNLKMLAKWSFNGNLDKQDSIKFKELQEKYDWKHEPGGAQFFFGTLDFRSSIGINLHTRCSRQIFASFHLNPGVNYQAASRLLRYGQTADEVNTVYLVTENSIEPETLRKVFRRFERNNQVISGRKAKREKSMAQEMMDLIAARRKK